MNVKKEKKAIVITTRQEKSRVFSFHANAINFLKIDIQIPLESVLKKMFAIYLSSIMLELDLWFSTDILEYWF